MIFKNIKKKTRQPRHVPGGARPGPSRRRRDAPSARGRRGRGRASNNGLAALNRTTGRSPPPTPTDTGKCCVVARRQRTPRAKGKGWTRRSQPLLVGRIIQGPGLRKDGRFYISVNENFGAFPFTHPAGQALSPPGPTDRSASCLRLANVGVFRCLGVKFLKGNKKY